MNLEDLEENLKRDNERDSLSFNFKVILRP